MPTARPASCPTSTALVLAHADRTRVDRRRPPGPAHDEEPARPGDVPVGRRRGGHLERVERRRAWPPSPWNPSPGSRGARPRRCARRPRRWPGSPTRGGGPRGERGAALSRTVAGRRPRRVGAGHGLASRGMKLIPAALAALLAMCAPAVALPTDPPITPLTQGDGATVRANASGVPVTFTCPAYVIAVFSGGGTTITDRGDTRTTTSRSPTPPRSGRTAAWRASRTATPGIARVRGRQVVGDRPAIHVALVAPDARSRRAAPRRACGPRRTAGAQDEHRRWPVRMRSKAASERGASAGAHEGAGTTLAPHPRPGRPDARARAGAATRRRTRHPGAGPGRRRRRRTDRGGARPRPLGEHGGGTGLAVDRRDPAVASGTTGSRSDSPPCARRGSRPTARWSAASRPLRERASCSPDACATSASRDA